MGQMIKKVKEKSVSTIRHILLFKIGAVARRFRKRPLPLNPDGKVFVHIGCGDSHDKRYINIDARPGWHIHYVDYIENVDKILLPQYADLIYACHVLEHVSHLKLRRTLKGLYNCLKKEGVLRLSVPDFDTLVRMYLERHSVNDIIAPLMGGQGYPGNFHHSVFNEEYLKGLLMNAGFKEVRKWDPESTPDHNFDDWSRRKIYFNNKEWQISLNLEAIK
jgi:predicted SAM-dependent methyltransferase